METNYFKPEEFKCKCCGVQKMNTDFIRKLNEARGKAHVPFKITSGYRCEKHNTAVGSKEDSAHRKGLGVDIACRNSTLRLLIIRALMETGFTRIGVAKDFIHVDMKNDSKLIWVY